MNVLKKKDAGRARLQVLARKPSHAEIRDEVTSRCVFDRGAVKGFFLLRIWRAQGHSGLVLRRGAYPVILTHSAWHVHQEQVCPGRLICRKCC